MCRCSDRRAAIIRSAGAVVRGDLRQVRAEAAFVARSAVEDVGQAARQRLDAARARLARR